MKEFYKLQIMSVCVYIGNSQSSSKTLTKRYKLNAIDFILYFLSFL